jgi:hypothetical protein
MAKKQRESSVESFAEETSSGPSSTLKLLPSEWARSTGKNEKLYFYFDKKHGVVTEEEFDRIEV